jgi:hypothetical protein
MRFYFGDVMALTFTLEDLENLKKSLLTGATRVRIGDREVEYRSLSEIAQLIKEIEAQLNPTTPKESLTFQPTWSKK